MVVKRRCKFCGKTLVAWTETQADYNLRMHENACEKRNKKAEEYFTRADKLLHDSQNSLAASKEAKGRYKRIGFKKFGLKRKEMIKDV